MNRIMYNIKKLFVREKFSIFNGQRKVLYLFRGVPGSGKSSTAANLGFTEEVLCEADQFMYVDGVYKFTPFKLKRAHRKCQEKCERLMKVNEPYIAVANTFTREWEMEAYKQLADKYGYQVYYLIVENRHNGVNQHGCAEQTVQAMKDRFEIKL